MKKKTIALVFAALFLVLSLLPSIGMLAFGGSRAAANETLSRLPKLRLEDGSVNPSVLAEATDYAADHFAFRNELVNAWAELNARVFRTSSEEQVILGSNDWLYYASTLDDYRGCGMNETELTSAARNLSMMQEYAQSCGADFIFTIAPNKNSLYPENMPSYIPFAHEKGNSAQIEPLLRDHGLSYCDLFSPFLADEEVLYYHTDSHWTDRGAALAADTILASFGKKANYYHSEFTEESQHLGDLYAMLYPTGSRTETAYSYAKGFRFVTEANPNGGNAMRIDTTNEKADGTLLCWRDSFGISLYPYLAESFKEAHFSRESSYNLTEITKLQADHVLIELVERNIPWLIRYAPVMPAPQRTIDLASARKADVKAFAAGREDSKYELYHLSGEIPCAYSGEQVYIVAGDAAFEACLTEKDGTWSYHAYLEPDVEATALCIGTNPDLTIYPLTIN